METATLSAIAFTYYPKDLSPYSIEFDEAPETVSLEQRIKTERDEKKELWEHIKEDIATKFHAIVTDMTATVKDCPCLYCTFHFEDNEILAKVHIWISFLIPNCIIELYWYKRGQLTDVQADEIKTHIVEKAFSVVTDTMAVEFFPAALQGMRLPGVRLQHSKGGSATFRELFFTDYIAYF